MFENISKSKLSLKEISANVGNYFIIIFSIRKINPHVLSLNESSSVMSMALYFRGM
jgi:hypothetical protein